MRYEIEIPDEAAPGCFGVYVLYDGADEPLYIGQTRSLYRRILQHKPQPWWNRVRRLEWVPCETPTEARALKKGLIATYRPNGNQNDTVPLRRQSPQVLPDWIAAKIAELHETEVLAGMRHDHAEAERDRLNCYLAALRAAGWRLEPLGLPMSMTRERVRQRIAMAPSASTPFGVVAPAPTRKPKPPKRERPSIPPSVLTEMRELQGLARQVNGPTPLDSPLRAASERFTELLAEQHVAGVSIYRIAKQLGVTPRAIRSRLARHGYMDPVGNMPNPKYGTPWAPGGTRAGKCKAGHDLTDPETVRFINGDPKRRVCRLCEARRAAEYYARKKAAVA